MEKFAFVGETLRRLRKDRGLTLQKLGAAAGLGRGQLSRIENGHQEATLSTLAKILGAQTLTRNEFFRRYDLVEAEALEVGKGAAEDPAAPPPATDGGSSWPPEIQQALSKLEAVARATFNLARPVARGAIEVGDLMILFRVVPRGAVPVVADEVPAADEPRKAAQGRGRRPGRSPGPGRKRKN